jgi:TRAP-type C4-dicarboxylate transport system substrate-binding protein
MRKIKIGQLQGGAFTGGELSAVVKDAQVYSLPFVFKNADEVDKVRARLDPLLKKAFAEAGFEVAGISGGGFAYLMSTHEMHSRDDLRSSKVWVPANDHIGEMTFKNGGITPIPLPLSDVFTSLQTGLVDTVPTTPAGAVALQWHGKLRTMLDLPLSFVVGYVVLDSKAWQKLAPADQAIVSRAFQSAARRVDANIRHDDAAALAVMKKQGLTVNAMEPAEAARWRKIGAQVTRDMEADKHISANLVSSIRQAIAGVH